MNNQITQSELDAVKKRIKEEIKLIFSDENSIIKQNTTSLDVNRKGSLMNIICKGDKK